MVVVLAAEAAHPYRALGQRIAEARNGLRWSQRELARAAHISEGYLPRIETGRNRPDPAVLKSLARVLGIDYTELAALADYVDRPQGDVMLAVPTDKAARVRWFAALPTYLQDRARRLLDAATDERDDVGEQETDPDAEAGAHA